MIGLGLRQLQAALNQRADRVQHEFLELSETLEALGKRLLEDQGEEREALRAEQKELRARQAQVAEEVNLWRERARAVLQTRGGESLRAFIQGIVALGEDDLTAPAQHALYVMDASAEELESLATASTAKKAKTPAGRLLDRARTEYDLRAPDSAARLRSASEFANRPGNAQDLEQIAEIEAALDDPDPLVRELAVHTAVQLHRFRAMRLADLDAAHAAGQRLAQFSHRAAVPVLIELLETPRSGFLETESGPVDSDNNRTRMVALLRLVEWHTPEAQKALRARTFDRAPTIVKAAQRALELVPGEWGGPLKTTGPLRPPRGG